MDATLRFCALGTTASVRCACPEVAARLTVCYAALPGHDAAEEQCLLAACERGAGGYRITVTGRDAVRAHDVDNAVRLLNHELMHGLMLRAPRLLYVHAGVACVGGRAVVLPGMSRAGKSTLTLALLRQGARLLSDELAAFDPGAGALCAFPRAVKVRDECMGYFPDLADRCIGDGEARFVPLAALGAGAAAAAVPALVVAPRWEPGGDDRLEPCSAGEGLLWLTRSALNFGTHRAQSLCHLASLTRDARHFALRWRDPHAAAAGILAAIG